MKKKSRTSDNIIINVYASDLYRFCLVTDDFDESLIEFCFAVLFQVCFGRFDIEMTTGVRTGTGNRWIYIQFVYLGRANVVSPLKSGRIVKFCSSLENVDTLKFLML